MDLVKRLRDAAALPTGLYAEAADEIERLRQVCRDAYEVWAGSEGIPEPVALVGELCDTSRADALRRGYSVGQYLFTHPAPTPDETAKLREQLAAVTREFEFQRNAHRQAQELLLEQGQQLAATQAEVEALRQKLSEAESDQLSWLTYRHVVDRVEDLEREAVGLRGQLEESRANDRTAMGYLSQVRAVVGGDDFPDMVKRVEALRKDAERAIDLLAVMFDKYEDGADCYEDPDDCSGHLGKAIDLEEDEFSEIADLLNRLCPRAAMQPAADEAGKGK